MQNTNTRSRPRLQVVSDNDGDQIELPPNKVIHACSTFDDLATLPRRDWLYGRHFLRGAVTATIADGGVGKTTHVITEAIAMVTGHNLLGVAVPKPVAVLYLNLEESADEIKRRIDAVCQQHGIDPVEELTDGLSFQSGLDHPVIVAKMERGSIITCDDIHEAFSFDPFDVVIVDPFNRCHLVPENDNSGIAAVVNVWASVAARHKVAVELVHHSRKAPHGGAPEIGAADARGASSFIDAVRSARTLNRMTETEGAQAKVDDHRDYFRIDSAKSNFAKASDGAAWFKKISVTISNGEEVGAVVPWKYPGAFDGVTAAHLTRIRLMAGNGEYRSNPQSDDWIGVMIADVLDLDAKDDAKRIKKLIRTWIETGALKIDIRKDARRHDKSFVVPGDWSEQ